MAELDGKSSIENNSDIEYLRTEIEKMFTFFLLESAEFPQCGAYQKAEVLSDVLALFKTLPQKQLTHSIIEWYDTENCPENNRPILAYTANKKFMTIKNVRDSWKWYTDKYAIIAWAYQDKININ